jgi:hypothetical protein
MYVPPSRNYDHIQRLAREVPMSTARLLKLLLAPAVLFAAMHPGCARETEPQSFAEALALASRAQMPVLVEFYSDG